MGIEVKDFAPVRAALMSSFVMADDDQKLIPTEDMRHLDKEDIDGELRHARYDLDQKFPESSDTIEAMMMEVDDKFFTIMDKMQSGEITTVSELNDAYTEDKFNEDAALFVNDEKEELANDGVVLDLSDLTEQTSEQQR